MTEAESNFIMFAKLAGIEEPETLFQEPVIERLNLRYPSIRLLWCGHCSDIDFGYSGNWLPRLCELIKLCHPAYREDMRAKMYDHAMRYLAKDLAGRFPVTPFLKPFVDALLVERPELAVYFSQDD
jgi:hypothetical protein